MRYSILNFNQQAVTDLQENINVTDLLILDYIYGAVASPSMKHIVKNGIAYVWLSHDKILEDLPILGITKDHLKKRLKKLLDINLLGTQRVFNESKGSTSYYCITTKCEQLRFSGPSVKNNTSNPDQVLKITLGEEEPSVKNNTSYSRLISIDKQLKKEDNKNIREFVDLYKKYCNRLPSIRSLTDKRKKGIENLLRKYSMKDIIEVFKIANDSEFLTGHNDSGWKADIDFILREDKFVNILEGKYDGQSSKKFVESGKKHVESFTEEDRKKLDEFQEKLRKEGKQVIF